MTGTHFNELTPGELERLAVLAEEMGEAIQIIGKIMRHGYESVSPIEVYSLTNRRSLAQELGDVAYAIEACIEKRDIEASDVDDRRQAKAIKIQRWLHHQ